MNAIIIQSKITISKINLDHVKLLLSRIQLQNYTHQTMSQDNDESDLFFPQDNLALRMSTRLARIEVEDPWRTQEMKEIDATMYASQPGPRQCPINEQEMKSNPYYVNPGLVE